MKKGFQTPSRKVNRFGDPLHLTPAGTRAGQLNAQVLNGIGPGECFPDPVVEARMLGVHTMNLDFCSGTPTPLIPPAEKRAPWHGLLPPGTGYASNGGCRRPNTTTTTEGQNAAHNVFMPTVASPLEPTRRHALC